MENMRLNHRKLFEIMAANKTLTNSFISEPFVSVKAKEGTYPNLTLCYDLNELDSAAFEQFNKAVEQKTASPYFIFPQNETSILLETLFKKSGYRAVDQWISMRISTNTSNAIQNTDLTVVRVETENQLEQWLQIVSATLFNNRTINRGIFSYLMNEPGINLWLGMSQNNPVSTALTFEKENTFGLYMVSTLAEMQGQGFGQSMVQNALGYAKTIGCEELVLQSTRAGINLYKKMGFEEVEKLVIYWKAGKEFI
jgi:ribosomal protein S18 acetylase RimI-like enzyme